MNGRIGKLFSSPYLTVGLLFYSVFLVFAATLAQVDMGIERAASEYFESFFVLAKFGAVKLPLLGGAAVGILFVLNVLYSMFARLTFGASGIGNSILHCALVLLVVSGVLQYFMRHEGRVVLREGEATNTLLVSRSGVNSVQKLPFTVKLLKFTREDWQGSDIPKSFSSKIVFSTEKSTVEALVEMNNPALFMGWAFYQSSYADGGKTSVLTAVKNPARMLPWVSVGAAFAGMVLAFAARIRRKK